MLRLHFAIALALAAGCADDAGDLPPFRIQLSLDPEEGCTSTACADYGMGCGATLSVRITAADDPTVLLGDQCVEVPPSTDLCALGEAQVADLRNLPLVNARIEVAVWPPPPEGETPSCPTGIFDLRGIPRLDVVPQPAFARSIYFDLAGGDTAVTVPLACSDSSRIDLAECAEVETYVRADVDDIDSLVGITVEQAEELAVFVGSPVARTNEDTGETTWSFETASAFQLNFVAPSIAGFAPYFEASVPGGFGADVCALVTDLGAAQATPAVKCSRETPGAGSLGLRGFLVSKPTLDAIVAAIGEPSFPQEGLLIGRVVDHTGGPLAGVRVTSSNGSVSYLSSDLTTTAGLIQTSASGYFVSSDATFGSTWTAIHFDGRAEQGSYQAGLVRGRVAILVMRMEPPL